MIELKYPEGIELIVWVVSEETTSEMSDDKAAAIPVGIEVGNCDVRELKNSEASEASIDETTLATGVTSLAT